MALFRVGVTFDSSTIIMGEELARAEKHATPNSEAWLYDGKAKHWELCRVDHKTGKLFTTGQLEMAR